MKILLTGAGGFLGSVILDELKKHHNIHTLGRSIRNHIQANLTEPVKLQDRYDMVIHCAGKAHSVPKTDAEKEEFFRVNNVGTQNLLDALKINPPDTFVFISTVAVYGKEEGGMIQENEALQPAAAYGMSKWEAEKKVILFARENKCHAVILRLPLVVGRNPPGNLGAMIRSIRRGYYVRLGKGESRRSMVLAGDIATFIPNLLHRDGIFNLTDGHHPCFFELENQIAEFYHKRIKSLPLIWIKMMAKVGDLIPGFPLNTYRLKKLTSTLTFSDERARKELGWTSHAVVEDNSWLNED